MRKIPAKVCIVKRHSGVPFGNWTSVPTRHKRVSSLRLSSLTALTVPKAKGSGVVPSNCKRRRKDERNAACFSTGHKQDTYSFDDDESYRRLLGVPLIVTGFHIGCLINSQILNDCCGNPKNGGREMIRTSNIKFPYLCKLAASDRSLTPYKLTCALPLSYTAI